MVFTLSLHKKKYTGLWSLMEHGKVCKWRKAFTKEVGDSSYVSHPFQEESALGQMEKTKTVLKNDLDSIKSVVK